ncbi:hypothetical protein [Qipengyuania nanhaisediminis]|uniref:hypothetical protein n=1 Tax=Qipengyuania nanhaisediminis TaxID=604088 RepID=UPI0038B3B705
MRLASLLAAGALALGTVSPASAETPAAVVELHDYENGEALVREHFARLFTGEKHSVYQADTCTASQSLYVAPGGTRDTQPVAIAKVMLLGDPGALETSPAYLVEGHRTVRISGRETSLPCVWLVHFRGNRVRAVREAADLRYLLPRG